MVMTLNFKRTSSFSTTVSAGFGGYKRPTVEGEGFFGVGRYY